jgi:hypothetical protein
MESASESVTADLQAPPPMVFDDSVPPNREQGMNSLKLFRNFFRTDFSANRFFGMGCGPKSLLSPFRLNDW